MKDDLKKGRVTIPTDLDVVPETIEVLKKWGADAIRDCDGTEFPEELTKVGAKIYSTYYTTRKDNAWAKANPDEVQQCYIMTGFYTADGGQLRIPLMQGISEELMQVNTRDDIKRWWEVMDRTTGQPLSHRRLELRRGHRLRGHPRARALPRVHRELPGLPHLGPRAHVQRRDQRLEGLRAPDHLRRAPAQDPQVHHGAPAQVHRRPPLCERHPLHHLLPSVHPGVRRAEAGEVRGLVRLFRLVSPYILEQFEKEVGYKFRPEYIIDQGYYNNQYRVPSKEFKDFMAFQRREVAKLAKEMVDITHELGMRSHDVPGRPLDRHRALHAGVRLHRPGRRGGQRGQRLHPAPDQRHPRRQVHRGPLPALLLPRHLPRGRRPREGSQGELGDRPPRHPAQARSTASATAAI